MRSLWNASRHAADDNVVQRLSNDVEKLDVQKNACGDPRVATGGQKEQLMHSLSADVQTQLQRVLQGMKDLTVENQDRAVRATGTRTHDAVQMLEDFVAADLPVQLLADLPLLDFEARKHVMNVCSALLWDDLPSDIHDRIIDYLCRDTRIFSVLVDGYVNDDAWLPCGVVLRSCLRHKELVAAFLASGQVFSLIRHTEHGSFDIASDAFCSLREALTEHKDVSAAWLLENCSKFFGMFNMLLQSENYLVQRQASSLLASMLVDPHFTKVMVPYVSEVANLRITMNLLRNPSKAIRIEAFNVLKLFVANPRKPSQVKQILCKNKMKLIELVRSLEAVSSDDQNFCKQQRIVVERLTELSVPARDVRSNAVPAMPASVQMRSRVIMAL